MRRERSVFALTSAIGCAIVIFLSIGVAGMFSLFIPEYMAEYGYSKMEMSYVAMVATVSGFLFSLIGSKLINALGPKKSLLVGSLASAVFLCLIGSVDNLVALGLVSLAQGAVLGLGAHASCAGVIAGWYGDRMASVIGVVFGFSSFGSTVFSLLAGQLLKVMSYHTILVSFGIGAAVIGVLANLLLIRMPAAQRPAAEVELRQAKQSGAAAAPTEEDGVGYHRAIRSPAFVLFFIAMMGAATLYAGFMTFATAFWQSCGMSATQSATNISFLSFFGALISMVSGVILEKFGSKVLMMLTFGGYIVGMVLVCMFPANPVPWFAVVGVLFVAFVRPVNSVPSLVLPELFGRKDYNRINSLGMAGYYLGATISSFLVAWISEISGSYTNSYMCLAVIALISFVLFFVAIRLSPYRREQHAAKKS